jgi:putative membrane protein
MTLTANPEAARRKWLRWGALGAVVLVPLAFAGLFVAALSQSSTALDRIPAAIVNEDSLITTTAADGTQTNVFAGRQLVTELTGTGSAGFEWSITNAADAEAALASGKVYAILTVPANFSSSILSISTATPVKADIAIRTDDSHSYLTGAVVQAVGQSMVSAFGNQITSQYISGIYSSLGDVGASLSQAADGASQLSSGASELRSGLSSYAGGVTSLSSGLRQLNSGAAGLTQLSSGVSAYSAGVAQLSGGLSQLNAGLQANPAISPQEKAALQSIVDGLASASAGGATLSQSTSTAISGIQSGIGTSAGGASTLAASGPALVSGASSLSAGATELATGLSAGAAQVPAFDAKQSAASAAVASDPVTLSVSTDNPVSDVGQAIATFFVPLGLWIGALAVFLVLRPVTRRALASTAQNGRLVFSALLRAGAVTAAQAALLVGLLHVTLGVSWAYLPATAAFSLLTAFAFTAFHYLLTVGLGRAGLVVSLFVVAIQVTSTGGLYPIELLSAPFQWISPLLPLTYGVSGMQAIISGGSASDALGAAVVLAGFAAASVILSLLAIRRTRRAGAIGLLPRTA